jgi:hypothetical protein
MTFLTPFIAAMATSLALTSQPDCSLPKTQRAFTNADLERMAACRSASAPPEPLDTPSAKPRREASPSRAAASPDSREADWRAQWRSVDQKVRRLRREAYELRQEAAEAPRDPKKKPTGRRSPALLLTRARSLDAEALELEEEFQERARREGALPGWLRPAGR